MRQHQKKKPNGPTPEERQRVLDAYHAGEKDWVKIARHNGIGRSAAYVVVKHGRTEDKPRGGHRDSLTKVTTEMLISLEEYLENDASITLGQMHVRLMKDYGVPISESTISRHLLAMTYTVKDIRVEKDAMNSDANKAERKLFAEKLARHRAAGHMIVYVDETNYNCYVSRTKGRSKCGDRATIIAPASQGGNLQIQCAVSNGMGLVEYNFVTKSIDMDMNASFLLDTFQSALKWADTRADYRNKAIVIVLDNAGAHERSEDLLMERLDEDPTIPRERLYLLRLGPYSPMCNPIEGCFSVLKAEVKSYVQMNRYLLAFQPEDETLEERKRDLLMKAAEYALTSITPALVVNEELHCAVWWQRARDGEDMRLGE